MHARTHAFGILLQTMFILNIRQAAADTKDSLFTFGAGVDKRQCAFRFAFQKLMADLQVGVAATTCPAVLYLHGLAFTVYRNALIASLAKVSGFSTLVFLLRFQI